MARARRHKQTVQVAKAAPRGKQLPRPVAGRLVDRVALVMRDAEPTPFAFEGALRHGLRGCLILTRDGWSWSSADRQAREVITAALGRLGPRGRRPSWMQGQPEHVDDRTYFERTRCARCGWRLPPENRKFCSPNCAAAWRMAVTRRQRAQDIAAVLEVTDAA